MRIFWVLLFADVRETNAGRRRIASGKMKKPGRILAPRKKLEAKLIQLPNLLNDDVFYTPLDIEKLEKLGIETNDLQRAGDHIPDVSRGVSSIYGGWNNIDENGQNIIPFGFSSLWTSEEKAKIKEGALRMNQDLGCLELRQEDTSWENGIIFVPAYEIGRSGCFSALGVAQYFYNDGSFGYPETWQVIALSESCAGTSQATVQHEILHALGIHHEHNRPDRDSFLVVNTDAASSPSNFRKMLPENWDETGFEFDINSVMTYCSYCGALNGNVPVMTTRTGLTFSSNYL